MVRTKAPTRDRRLPAIIGWREHIGLPDLGIRDLAAKIDTGARTSALHAIDQRIFERDGKRWVEFMVPIHNRPTKRRIEAPLVDERDIKNTSGVPETRLVIRTTLLMGRRRWQIEVSLADRARMEFDIILGRTAIRRHRLLVHPGKSFLLGPRPEMIEQPNAAPSKQPKGTAR